MLLNFMKTTLHVKTRVNIHTRKNEQEIIIRLVELFQTLTGRYRVCMYAFLIESVH